MQTLPLRSWQAPRPRAGAREDPSASFRKSPGSFPDAPILHVSVTFKQLACHSPKRGPARPDALAPQPPGDVQWTHPGQPCPRFGQGQATAPGPRAAPPTTSRPAAATARSAPNRPRRRPAPSAVRVDRPTGQLATGRLRRLTPLRQPIPQQVRRARWERPRSCLVHHREGAGRACGPARGAGYRRPAAQAWRDARSGALPMRKRQQDWKEGERR